MNTAPPIIAPGPLRAAMTAPVKAPPCAPAHARVTQRQKHSLPSGREHARIVCTRSAAAAATAMSCERVGGRGVAGLPHRGGVDEVMLAAQLLHHALRSAIPAHVRAVHDQRQELSQLSLHSHMLRDPTTSIRTHRELPPRPGTSKAWGSVRPIEAEAEAAAGAATPLSSVVEARTYSTENEAKVLPMPLALDHGSPK
jgi:hypothetical protein